MSTFEWIIYWIVLIAGSALAAYVTSRFLVWLIDTGVIEL